MERFQEVIFDDGLIPITHYYILDQGDDYYEVFVQLARATNGASPMKANFEKGHYKYNPKSEQIYNYSRNEGMQKLILNPQHSLYINETYVRMEEVNGVMRLIIFNRIKHLYDARYE
jgi:hypothetical protein